MIGPVQVLVVGFEHPAFSGEVLAELTRLRQAGIVRLVDLLLVARTDDGALETVSAPAELGAGLGGLVADLMAQPGDTPVGDGQPADGSSLDPSAWSLGDAVPAGAVAAVALIEHVWAQPLTAAIRRAGGRPLEETWLPPADLERLAALIATRQGQPDGSITDE